MRTLLTILALCCTSFAQTTVFPKTTVFKKTTIFGQASGGGSPAVVQAVSFNCPNTATHCIVNNTNVPAYVTTGTNHLIIALCGGDSNANCVVTGPVSTPSATWTQLASSGVQDQAWYTCASSAFTAIDFGPFSQVDAVIEYSGVNTSGCLDKNPAMLGQNTTTWATSASGTTAQGHELIFGWISEFVGNPTWACSGSTQAILANGTSSSLIGCYSVVTTIGSYTISGTVTTAAASQNAGIYTFEYP